MKMLARLHVFVHAYARAHGRTRTDKSNYFNFFLSRVHCYATISAISYRFFFNRHV